ncbi:FG-GAP-like repeat-containing protein, partial [Pseudoalteromonas sp. C8]|uniref:FG-GAP-like repeat-containing protein n=1 Tax=Pseudoalteromonas sp. C8 TaxID=2686345 RepID=UPI0013FD2094
SLFNDTNADGVLDWISYKEDEQHTIVKLYSGDNFDLLNEFTITYPFDSVVFYTLQDRDFDDVEELGVFGFDSSKNRYQLLVHSGSNGAKLGAWNWPATLSDVSFEVLSDLTGDGVEEYAISGVHLSNGTRQLVVKDGMTRGNYQTFKWPNQWDSPKYVVMTDITSDGIPEVAMHGKHERLDKGQLFMYDGANANSKLDVYNWNPLWDDISLHQMDDLDGDGTTDWGQFGKRKDDGRYQWLVKKGNDKRGVIRTFSWPNDLINVKPLLVSDRTNDGIRDVAIVGTHPTTDKVFLRINDGRLANQRITNFSWPGNWEDTQVVELGDLNNDGFNEFALLGYTKTNRAVQVVVKDGRLTTEYGRYTLPGKWEGISLSHYDTNNDGVEDIVISGISQT